MKVFCPYCAGHPGTNCPMCGGKGWGRTMDDNWYNNENKFDYQLTLKKKVGKVKSVVKQ